MFSVLSYSNILLVQLLSKFTFPPPRGGLSYTILQVSGAQAKSVFIDAMFLLNG